MHFSRCITFREVNVLGFPARTSLLIARRKISTLCVTSPRDTKGNFAFVNEMRASLFSGEKESPFTLSNRFARNSGSFVYQREYWDR